MAIGAAHALYYWPEVIDDAYIVFRYARNFERGFGFSFNPGGGAVEGFSTLTRFKLSVLGLMCGAHDLLTWVKVAGFLIHLATIVMVWALAQDGGGRARPLTLLAPLAFALNPFAAYHAVAGLETPLAAALLAAVVLALLRLGRSPRAAPFLAAVALVHLLATRPEAFGYAGALLAGAWWVHRGDASARRRLNWVAVAVAIGFAGLLAWRFATFGALLPNTAAAKSAGPSGRETFATGLFYVARFFTALRLPTDLVLAAVAAWILLRRGGRREALLAIPVACAAGFAVAVRGDWMQSFRFMVPCTPFLAALVARAACAATAGRGAERRGIGRVALAAGAALIVSVLAQQAMLERAHADAGGFGRTWKPRAWPARIGARLAQGYEARLAGFTRWSLEHLSTRHSVATGDIGFPAWTLDERVVDLAGLTDRTLGRLVPARDAKGYADYLARLAPDVLVYRVEDGHPAALYDALTETSGILSRYALTDSVATYGRAARAYIYVRAGVALEEAPDSVRARYDRALRWNPRVGELARWRADYLRAHPR